jgi:hypothetical protein
MLSEDLLIGILVVVAFAEFSHRAYVAWLKPHKHQQYLEWIGRFYRGWYPAGEKWWSSPINFWIMRFVFLGGFLLAGFALIHRIYILVL